MTPFGAKLRTLRVEKGVTLKQMARDVNVSPAYLSALEHGKRGRPSPGLVMEICGYFGIIWDGVETMKDLAALSHPKVTIDTSGLHPKATELANRLALVVDDLDEAALDRMLAEVKE